MTHYVLQNIWILQRKSQVKASASITITVEEHIGKKHPIV